MNGNNRIWVLGTFLVCAAVLALGWFLGVSPQLDAASQADQQKQSIDDQNRARQAVIAGLKAQFAGIEDLRTQVTGLQAAIPADANLSQYVLQINDNAAVNGVGVASVAFGDGVYVPLAAPVAPAAPAAPGAPAATPTPTAVPTPTPTPAAVPAPVPAAGIVGKLVAIPVTLKVTGTYSGYLGFVNALQSGERIFLLSTMTATADAAVPGTFVVNIAGYIYVLQP